MIFILAYNRDTAKHIAMLNDVLPKDWLEATKNNLLGYKNQVLWLASGYRKNPNYSEVVTIAKDCCFRIFELHEVEKYKL